MSASETMYEYTAQRLRNYSEEFSPEVVDQVAESAERQLSFDNTEAFINSLGTVTVTRQEYDGYHPVDILDIKPKEYDPAELSIVHLAMMMTLDGNQIYQVGNLAAVNPNKRFIAVAATSGPGYNSNILTPAQCLLVAKGDFSPASDPLLRFTEEEGVEWTKHISYSRGTEVASIAIARGNFAVSHAVAIEPPAFVGRNLIELMQGFAKSAGPVKGYVEATKTPNFFEARKHSVGAIPYYLGFLRLTNIATGQGLTKPLSEPRMREALLAHPEMKLMDAWGSESELCLDGLATMAATRLGAEFGNRFRPFRLPGQKHGLANDIQLQSALVLEGTR